MFKCSFGSILLGIIMVSVRVSFRFKFKECCIIAVADYEINFYLLCEASWLNARDNFITNF